MNQVEVVITNYMRPFNIPLIINVLRSQSVPCTITIIDAGMSANGLKSDVIELADRHYPICHNYGPSNRYFFIEKYDHEFTLFLDDDYLPGFKLIEYFLSFKSIQKMGVLGQEGRLLTVDGDYDSQNTPRTQYLSEVDLLVRGYFLRTELLQIFESFIQGHHIDMQDLEDDIALCASVKIAGFNNYLLPTSDKSTLMVSKELPAPNAWWQRPHHLARRSAFCHSLIQLGWNHQRRNG